MRVICQPGMPPAPVAWITTGDGADPLGSGGGGTANAGVAPNATRAAVSAARTPELGQGGAFAQPVTGPAPQRERTLTGIGGVLPPVKQPRFVGKPVPQTGRRRSLPGREAQSPLELRRRLAM